VVAPRERRAAKVIVVDGTGSVLLFRGGDLGRPADSTWWFPPGGGVDEGETAEQAAIRELREETGLEVQDVGPPIATRRAQFDFEGISYDLDEVNFLLRVDRFELDETGWSEAERRAIVEHHWWSQEELAATAETVYPEGRLSMLRERA
jgi:8-oxo-dGTP pyrophosphatase MutT (NUDIX family)